VTADGSYRAAANATLDGVLQDLTDVLADDFGVPRAKVVPEAHMFGDLELDSLDLLSVIAVMEQRLNITILDEDIGHMVTVRGAAEVILSKLAP
jgi:acyl carrier protein